MSSIVPNDRSTILVNAQLIFPILIRPILAKIEKRSNDAGKELLETMKIVEASDPTILLELVNGIVVKSMQTTNQSCRNINLIETLINAQHNIPDYEEQICRRNEEVFQEFKNKTFLLKRNLSRLPREIDDRNKLLATIRRIAEIIKSILDCLSLILNNSSTVTSSDKRLIEQRKREFITDSKDFSSALKEFFRIARKDMVLLETGRLIKSINNVQRTVKQVYEQKELILVSQ